MAVQCLRLRSSAAGGMGSKLGRETKISEVQLPRQVYDRTTGTK